MAPTLLVAGGHGPLGAALRAALANEGTLRTLDFPAAPHADVHAAATIADASIEGPIAAVIDLLGPHPLAAPSPRREAARAAALARAQALSGWVAARPRRPAVLVQLSSALAYADHGDQSLDENAPVGGAPTADVFAAHVAATAPAAAAGVRVVELRAGMVLGAGLGLHAALSPLLSRRLRPRHLGRAVPWIDLEDLIAVLRAALHMPELSGPLHVASPGQLDGKGLLQAMAGRSLLPAPRRLCARLAPEVDIDAVLGTARRLRPTALLARGWQPLHPWPRTNPHS